MLDIKLFNNKRNPLQLIKSNKVRIHISYIVKNKYFEARVETQENCPLLKIVYKDN